MECVAVINQKGGVGKTATATNLGAGLSKRGDRVLLIDMDPQGHLTTHLGLDAVAKGAGVYEVLTRNLPVESAIHTHSEGLSVIPSQIDLAAAEVELVSVVGREVILRDALAPLSDRFDIALIDCPPSLGILTLNSLSVATRVIIPLQPHFLALQGVGKLLETVALVSARINPKLSVLGMLICMYESGTRLGGEVIKDLESFLGDSRKGASAWREARIFASRIRRNVKLAESPSYGQSIFDYAPKSNGAEDYLALADEVRVLLGRGEEVHEAPPASREDSRLRCPPVKLEAPAGAAAEPPMEQPLAATA